MTIPMRWPRLWGGPRGSWLFLAWLLLLLVAFQGHAAAAPSLTITPISWNVIGLDSNNVNVGPNRYPVGARVCNVGDAAATNVRASIVLDGGTTNRYISVFGQTTLTAASLPAGSAASNTQYQQYTAPSNCTDFYFLVDIARDGGAYSGRVSDTATPAQRNTQLYHIEAVADNASLRSTPANRELYVEKLISQGRNSIAQFSGPANVLVGGTYTYTLNTTTAPGGYEQLEVFTNFPNNLFQITNVSTTYTSPAGGVNSTVYADACGWENDRTSTSYHNNLTCIGPANYSGAKAGDIISTRFTVKILSAGTATVQSTINDFSGSSYHYNADFGDSINAVSITASNPVSGPDLLISKTHTSLSLGSAGTYTLGVSNGGGSPTSGTVTVTDTLPPGLNPTGTSGTVNGWTCTVRAATNSAQGSVSCTRSDALAAGASYPDISIPVSVTATRSGTVTNTATVSGGNDTNTNNNSASDPTTLTASTDLGLTKVQTTPAAGTTVAAGGTVAYTIAVTNKGSSSADGAILSDSAVSGFTAATVTCSSSSNQSACPASPTVAQLQSGIVIPTFAKSTSLTFIVTGTAVANSAYKITNTATISPASGFADTNTADNIATATTSIQNPPPVAVNDSASTNVNTAVAFSVTANDTDTAPGTVNAATVDLNPATTGTQTISTETGKGTFVVDSSGNATFTPVTGFSGRATATYTVQDNVGALSNTATITVTVNPTAAPDTNTVNGNLTSYAAKNSVITTVLSNDLGTGLATSSVIFPTQSAGTVTNSGKTLTSSQGVYTVGSTGTVTFTPADGFSGAASPVTYQVSDANGLTATSTLTVTVNAPPVAVNDSANAAFNTAVTFSVTANDTDAPPGMVNPATVDLDLSAAGVQTSVTVSGKGTFTVNASGTVTFTPVSGFSGTVTTPYTVRDNDGALSNPATISVQMTAFAGAADLTLVKTVPAYAAPSTPGDSAATPPVAAVVRTITYTLTVTNSGTAATSSTVTVVDTLPAGLSATAMGGTGWSCALSTLTCTRSDVLAASSSYPAIVLTVRAPSTAELATTASLRDLTNSAAVSGGGESNTGNNAGTANTKMVYARLTKKVRNFTAGSAFASTSAGQPGQVLEYCIDFTNDGGAALSAFKVTDNVPGNTASLTTGYDADAPGTATGFGLKLTRGAGTPVFLTSSAADTDAGNLGASSGLYGSGVMEVVLPTALSPGETGSVCFKATIN